MRTGTSINKVLPERDNQGYYGNKGYVVGDGGSLLFEPNVRQDFRPCAYWGADLITDANGRVSSTFKAPDSLTRYRLIAVACDEERCFGSRRVLI